MDDSDEELEQQKHKERVELEIQNLMKGAAIKFDEMDEVAKNNDFQDRKPNWLQLTYLDDV